MPWPSAPRSAADVGEPGAPLREILEHLRDGLVERLDPWSLVVALTLLLLVATLGWLRTSGRATRTQVRRMRRAGRGEAEAERLLLGEGYRILERQAFARWSLVVGGRVLDVASRADLLVEKNGRVLVADVKTGNLAPDPRRPSTRRQLLEYLLVFAADGALVVDVETARIVEVDYGPLLDGLRSSAGRATGEVRAASTTRSRDQGESTDR